MAQALFWKGFSVDDRRRLFVTSPASVPIIDANSNALFVKDARRPLSLDRRELAEPRRWRPDGRRGGGGASAPVFDSPTSCASKASRSASPDFGDGGRRRRVATWAPARASRTLSSS